MQMKFLVEMQLIVSQWLLICFADNCNFILEFLIAYM